ncbi:MAG: helix-turn-helix domain-containing protein [Thermoleophilaceae bacterium]
MPRTTTSELTAKAVGEEIRRARKQLALTQLELARRLGASQSYVAHVEAGRENLTIGKLAQIAGALGTALKIQLPLVERAAVAVPEDQAAGLTAG